MHEYNLKYCNYFVTKKYMGVLYQHGCIGGEGGGCFESNFSFSGTGTVYIGNVELKIEPQQYTISWTGVIDNTSEQ